MFCLLVVNQKE
jgi:hypothetical protein